MSNQNTQKLAKKIANLLQNEPQSDEFNSLQMSIEKINNRLDKIESKLTSTNPKSQNPKSKIESS